MQLEQSGSARNACGPVGPLQPIDSRKRKDLTKEDADGRDKAESEAAVDEAHGPQWGGRGGPHSSQGCSVQTTVV